MWTLFLDALWLGMRGILNTAKYRKMEIPRLYTAGFQRKRGIFVIGGTAKYRGILRNTAVFLKYRTQYRNETLVFRGFSMLMYA